MTAPTQDPIADRLQQEVRRLKAVAQRRRAVPMLLNVGALGGARIVLPGDLAGTDHALRADLLTGALDRLGDPVLRSVWLTRGGALSVGEHDLLWRAAAETAFARHGVADPARGACFAVTRYGWLDVGEERSCEWPRLRVGPPPLGSSLTPSRDEEGSWALVG